MTGSLSETVATAFASLMQMMPLLLEGALVTLQITCLAATIGIVLGTLIALVQTAGVRPLRWLATTYVALVRGTPMLVQIAFMYFVLLPRLNASGSAFVAAVIAIGLNSAAYVSQTIRTGIMSVDPGQIEAGLVLGLSMTQIRRYIIIPQALRVALPGLGNEIVTLIKDSSLASTIGVVELYRQGRNIMSTSYDVIGVYCAITLTYLVLTSVASWLVAYFEEEGTQSC